MSINDMKPGLTMFILVNMNEWRIARTPGAPYAPAAASGNSFSLALDMQKIISKLVYVK